MPDAAVIAQFERRLAELACPEALARRKARELAEHHADLKEAALEEGLSEAGAAARADEQLGEGASLAEGLALVIRQSSWWGRHPVIGFCLLPPLGFVPLWLLCGSLLAGVVLLVGRLLGPAYLVDMDTVLALARDPHEFRNYSLPLVAWLNAGVSAMMAGLFCRLARRSLCGLRWMMTACAVCALGAAFTQFSLAPAGHNPGYSVVLGVRWAFSPNWICASLPCVVAAAACLRHRRRLLRLPALPRRADCRRPNPRGPARWWPKSILTTPTYWITALALAGILAVSLMVHQEMSRERAAQMERARRGQAGQ